MDESIEGRGLLSDQICNALTDEIASGALPAGITLDEQDLADSFGASRTPVREALRQLASSGLVEMRPRRGVVVTRMTPERIMEMFETTAEFEALCVRLATYRMTPIELSALMDLHARSAAVVAVQDYDVHDARNCAFHEALYRHTPNGFMAEQALAIRGCLSAFRRTQLRHGGHGERSRRSRAEHGEILRATTEATARLRRGRCAPTCSTPRARSAATSRTTRARELPGADPAGAEGVRIPCPALRPDGGRRRTSSRFVRAQPALRRNATLAIIVSLTLRPHPEVLLCGTSG